MSDRCELTRARISPLAKFQLSSCEDLTDSGVNFPTVDPVATDGVRCNSWHQGGARSLLEQRP